MARESKRAVYVTIAVNLAIVVVKFAAAAITGSSAMISEGIHSLVDAGNGVLLAYGQRQAEKAPDESHPFGHGRELYFWTFVVAISIFGIGGGMSIYEGIVHLARPTSVQNAAVAYIVLGVSFVIEAAGFVVTLRAFRAAHGEATFFTAIHTGKDPTLFAVVFENSTDLIGLAIAFIGVFADHELGLAWVDGVASIAIGLMLCGVALWLAFETKGLLVGEAAEPDVIEELDRLVRADPDVAEVGPILSMYNGPDDLLLNLEVEFREGLSAEDVHTAIHRIEDVITPRFPEIKRIFIEVSSLTPGAEPR